MEELFEGKSTTEISDILLEEIEEKVSKTMKNKSNQDEEESVEEDKEEKKKSSTIKIKQKNIFQELWEHCLETRKMLQNK